MLRLEITDIVAVIGAGAMGAGIAQVAATAGHPVVMFDARVEAAKAGHTGILASLDRQVARGKMKASTRDVIASRLTVAASMNDLAPARLVIEAIVENLEVKQNLFAQLETIVAEDAILATNTSSLSVTAIAAGLRQPGRVAGMHFFNPAMHMQLVEIISGLASASDTLQRLHDIALAWGKSPVRATSTPGFIVNRVARPFYAESLRLYEERVATPETLDAIMREAGGFRMGPFELMDLIGHDVNLAVTRSVFEAFFGDPRYRPSLIQQELVAAGWLGRKTGRGFYRHGEDAIRPEPATALPSPAPARVVVEGDLGPAEPLIPAMIAEGVSVDRRPGAGYLRLDSACLALGDGRSATLRVSEGAPSDLIVFDLAQDFDRATRIAVAQAQQAPPEALPAAAGLFQLLGKKVSVLADSPGLVVLRTLATLANEALEAVLSGVATPADIDHAMQLGVNYPVGPLSWADAVGASRILFALEAIYAANGDPRYRPSQLLRQCIASGRTLTGT
ncbi:MAG: 3-hydroxyacyl-CoA dehydrogenase [Gammaproteobacteria bacterium]|nr:3-hydroxyacyl-CoA dehydrogenase [Rhizobiaceae bacterium]MBU4115515.1 3-hydroxyacyl-CoA dehydrogenase [Gammaproteobacteria bacterium]